MAVVRHLQCCYAPVPVGLACSKEIGLFSGLWEYRHAWLSPFVTVACWAGVVERILFLQILREFSQRQPADSLAQYTPARRSTHH
jgi:hypothetical protein